MKIDEVSPLWIFFLEIETVWLGWSTLVWLAAKFGFIVDSHDSSSRCQIDSLSILKLSNCETLNDYNNYDNNNWIVVCDGKWYVTDKTMMEKFLYMSVPLFIGCYKVTPKQMMKHWYFSKALIMHHRSSLHDLYNLRIIFPKLCFWEQTYCF